ncbi:MAG: restriction endonuclease subunit S [Nitrospira sp.]|nr:restriction endonuclease subunit S [Nitrospira sp.]
MKNGWQTKKLGEVLQKTETINPMQSPETEFDYIDVSSVSNATFQIAETQHLKGRDAPSRARRLVKTNDVLFATVRPTLQRIAIVPEHLDNQVCSTGYFVLRPKPEVDYRFVFYSLFTEDFMGQMENLQKGASYPAVTDSEVRAQLIPIPPLPEQQRIVGILDEAFEGIATAKANTEKNLQNARALFDSHLNAVFTQCGDGWVEAKLKDLTELITCGVAKRPEYVLEGIPFLSAKNVKNGQVVWSGYRFVSEETHRALTKYNKPQLGDILYTRVGSYGEAAIIDREVEFSIFVSLTLIKPKSVLLNAFLKHYLNSSTVKQLAAASINGVGVGNLNVGAVREFPIHLPSVTEQRTIVAALDDLREKTQCLESIYQQKLAALDELKKSLLHQAFTGAL